ncbi:unnamed protein product [marine sediment metagenome]|uniref:Uncharacterized protein n=1 Tax=marine sediment metagenome TaxID=412755 RepID=X1LWQ0_9ZZZZ
MQHLEVLIPCAVIAIGAIVHIEVSIATLKNDVKWIKKYLNDKEK